MLKLSLKIWAVANLLVLLVIGILSLPHGFSFAAYAFVYSAVFSLPAVPLLYCLLKFLRFARSGLLFNWIVLLIGTAVISFLVCCLFALVTNAGIEDANFVFPLCFVSGYSAVVFLSPALHYLFQTFQYGNYENN